MTIDARLSEIARREQKQSAVGCECLFTNRYDTKPYLYLDGIAFEAYTVKYR